MSTLSLDAVIKRVNRALAHDDQQLRVTRGERLRMDVGDYHVIDWRRNLILNQHVDPEAMARELGVLRQDEAVGQ